MNKAGVLTVSLCPTLHLVGDAGAKATSEQRETVKTVLSHYGPGYTRLKPGVNESPALSGDFDGFARQVLHEILDGLEGFFGMGLQEEVRCVEGDALGLLFGCEKILNCLWRGEFVLRAGQAKKRRAQLLQSIRKVDFKHETHAMGEDLGFDGVNGLFDRAKESGITYATGDELLDGRVGRSAFEPFFLGEETGP